MALNYEVKKRVFGFVHNSEHPHPVFPPQLASFEL